MPTVNIYFARRDNVAKLQEIVPELKSYLAEELTCGHITLSPAEISIRFIEDVGLNMIGDVEIQISVHAFPERVQNQDHICLDVMKYIQEKTGIKNVKVWLQLSELGHSW